MESLDVIFLLQIFLSLSISFILYFYGIWSAGDAKYLLVLSLYIPYIGTLPFILNISLITIIYLLGYFIFFILKTSIKRDFRKTLFEKILIEQEDKIMNFFNQPLDKGLINKKTFIKLGRHVLYFLLFFVFLRLFRTDLIAEVSKAGLSDSEISDLGSYFLIIVSLASFLIIYYYRLIMIRFKMIISKKISKFHPEMLNIANIALSSFFLVMLIAYDYAKVGKEVFHKLYLILTLYLAISIGIKICFYLYRITFQIGEQNYIPIDELKEGEIIDKNYLLSLFGEQECLRYEPDKNKGGLYPDPKSYIRDIDNPISEESIKKLKDIYLTVNDHHNGNTKGFKNIYTIKILYSFAFGGYIFIGFMITFIYGDGPVNLLLRTALESITYFFRR